MAREAASGQKVLRPKGPLVKAARDGGFFASAETTSVQTRDARGDLDFLAVARTRAQEKMDQAKEVDFATERSPFLDHKFMELRCKALKEIRDA